MSKYIEKFRHLQAAIKQNGGLWGAYLSIYRTDELKWGTLIGEDQDGNKYYQNKIYPIGRSRWVHYSDQYGMDYDGSQVPSEWHKWLSYVTDDPPTVSPPPTYKWLGRFKENLTGTDQEYVPYSTTRPKVEAWSPPQTSK